MTRIQEMTSTVFLHVSGRVAKIDPKVGSRRTTKIEKSFFGRQRQEDLNFATLSEVT